MSGRRRPPVALAKRLAAELDVQSAGIAFALLGVLVAVLVFGLAPTGIALGLLALLVVE